MANFRTHVVGAAAPSAILASWLAYDHDLALPVAAACALCGAVGGLLPDVDSRESIPTRLVFSVVGVLSGVLAASYVHRQLNGASTHDLIFPILIGLLTYAFVRYVVSRLFHAVTVHRGVIHSIPMAAACGLGLFHVTCLVFPVSASVAFWPSLFLSGGFIAHLLLDEAYSVDLRGVRLKRSFGTALKLGSMSNLVGTVVVYCAIAGMGLALPMNQL